MGSGDRSQAVRFVWQVLLPAELSHQPFIKLLLICYLPVSLSSPEDRGLTDGETPVLIIDRYYLEHSRSVVNSLMTE